MILLLLWVSLVFSLEFCIKPVENPYKEPYLSYALRRNIENAILESGHKVGCGKDAIAIVPMVKDLKEIPIAYTPYQRVSAYNITLTVALKDIKGEKDFSFTVPYSLPTGGLGDLPRRQAIDNLLGIIYIELIQYFRRGY